MKENEVPELLQEQPEEPLLDKGANPFLSGSFDKSDQGDASVSSDIEQDDAPVTTQSSKCPRLSRKIIESDKEDDEVSEKTDDQQAESEAEELMGTNGEGEGGDNRYGYGDGLGIHVGGYGSF